VNTQDEDGRRVGPVLQATPFAEAVIAAIREENDDVLVRHEAAYLRVLVPGECRLSRSALRSVIGEDVHFPGDLEAIMSSFSGRMEITDHAAVWWIAGDTPPGPSEEDRN
jgi:toluene monooxygenase system protein D